MATANQPLMQYSHPLPEILVRDISETVLEQSHGQCPVPGTEAATPQNYTQGQGQVAVTEGEGPPPYRPINNYLTLMETVIFSDNIIAKYRLDALTLEQLLTHIIALFRILLQCGPPTSALFLHIATKLSGTSDRNRRVVIAHTVEAMRRARVDSLRIGVSTPHGVRDFHKIIDFWSACLKVYLVVSRRESDMPFSRAFKNDIFQRFNDCADFIKTNLLSLPGRDNVPVLPPYGEWTKQAWERKMIITIISEVNLLRSLA